MWFSGHFSKLRESDTNKLEWIITFLEVSLLKDFKFRNRSKWPNLNLHLSAEINLDRPLWQVEGFNHPSKGGFHFFGSVLLKLKYLTLIQLTSYSNDNSKSNRIDALPRVFSPKEIPVFLQGKGTTKLCEWINTRVIINALAVTGTTSTSRGNLDGACSLFLQGAQLCYNDQGTSSSATFRKRGKFLDSVQIISTRNFPAFFCFGWRLFSEENFFPKNQLDLTDLNLRVKVTGYHQVIMAIVICQVKRCKMRGPCNESVQLSSLWGKS